jgi:hypothetical protein
LLVPLLQTLGQFSPLLRHLQEHGLVPRICCLARHAQTLRGITPVLVSPIHIPPPAKHQEGQLGRASSVPYGQNDCPHDGTFENRGALGVAVSDENQSHVMQSPAQYRKYAEECERIARDGPAKNRDALLEIAKAWRDCADEMEQQQRRDDTKAVTS